MTTYTCARCSAPARVAGGGIVRSCACQSTVTAHLRARATGEGGACPSRPAFFLHSVLRAFASRLLA